MSEFTVLLGATQEPRPGCSKDSSIAGLCLSGLRLVSLRGWVERGGCFCLRSGAHLCKTQKIFKGSAGHKALSPEVGSAWYWQRYWAGLDGNALAAPSAGGSVGVSSGP